MNGRPSYASYESSLSGVAGYTTSVSGLWCSDPIYNQQPPSLTQKHFDETYQERMRSKYTPGVSGSTCDCYCDNSNYRYMVPYMSYTYNDSGQLGYGNLNQTPLTGTMRRGGGAPMIATFK